MVTAAYVRTHCSTSSSLLHVYSQDHKLTATTADMHTFCSTVVVLTVRTHPSTHQTLSFPVPTWGPNISLARRSYTAVANINQLGATFQAVDYVPATHSCNGGCGGGLVNSSNSVYIYNQGTCASPDNCVCVNRNSTGTPAFSDSNCETTVCTPLCVNGRWCTCFSYRTRL